MSSRFRTREFKRTQAHWYRKLAEEGFVDIENQDQLKVVHSRWFLARHKEKDIHETQSAKREYFRLAGHFLFSHQFGSELERAIWELHSEGYMLREIASRLRGPGNKLNKDNVNAIVRRLAELMLKEAA